MAFRIRCTCGETFPVDSLEEGRREIAVHGERRCNKHPFRPTATIEEFAPERIITVHPAVESKRFTLQYKMPEGGWENSVCMGNPWATLGEAQQAADTFCVQGRGAYRILETPGDIVHPVVAEPENVEVELRVRVPCDVYTGPYDLNVSYRFGAGDWRGVEIVSAKEVSRGNDR